MKIEAKQRLLATAPGQALTAAPLTEDSVKAFLATIGVDDYSTIDLANNKKSWEITDVYIGPDRIQKALGKPVVNMSQSEYALVVWNLKGKGAVVLHMDEGVLYLVNETGPLLLNTVVECMPNVARYKSFEINKKSKTISFQPYEKRGAKIAQKILQKIADGFGFDGWAVKMGQSHWGNG